MNYLMILLLLIVGCTYDKPVKTIDKIGTCTWSDGCIVRFTDGTYGLVLEPIMEGQTTNQYRNR